MHDSLAMRTYHILAICCVLHEEVNDRAASSAQCYCVANSVCVVLCRPREGGKHWEGCKTFLFHVHQYSSASLLPNTARDVAAKIEPQSEQARSWRLYSRRACSITAIQVQYHIHQYIWTGIYSIILLDIENM